jgi:cyclopropane fatty-acyl-phospholipid synthase-like methyltransferase
MSYAWSCDEEWRWLDVGVGTGALMGAAEEYGFTVTGLDLRPQAIESLKLDGLDARGGVFLHCHRRYAARYGHLGEAVADGRA